MNRNLVILFGGPSSERVVSFGTRDFFVNLYRNLSPVTVEWTEDNKFLSNNEYISESRFLKKIANENSIVLIASHGEKVEDGYIQEKLEKYRIPYTGSDSKSCKLAMNKKKSQEKIKHIVKTIPTYKSYKHLEFPFVAKPNSLGSSIGIFLIRNAEELRGAKSRFDKDYIFQTYITGRELSLGTVRNGNSFLKIYPTEIKPLNDFFDYESKYSAGMSTEITPANLGNDVTDRIISAANKIHDELGLGYYSRTDFILGNDGELYYLETNALPGMTSTSILPQQLNHTNTLSKFKEGLLEHLIVAAP